MKMQESRDAAMDAKAWGGAVAPLFCPSQLFSNDRLINLPVKLSPCGLQLHDALFPSLFPLSATEQRFFYSTQDCTSSSGQEAAAGEATAVWFAHTDNMSSSSWEMLMWCQFRSSCHWKCWMGVVHVGYAKWAKKSKWGGGMQGVFSSPRRIVFRFDLSQKNASKCEPSRALTQEKKCFFFTYEHVKWYWKLIQIFFSFTLFPYPH